MDKLILRAIIFILGFFKPAGVELDKLKEIVRTKLIMDSRRTRGGLSRSNNKEVKNPLIFTLIMYAFMGVFFSIMAFNGENIKAVLTFLHAYIMVMMIMTLITDFSAVLLDTTDSSIILPKPVSSKTFFMARVVHIFCYLLQLLIALILFPAIGIFVGFGIKAGLFSLLSFMLNTVFSVFIAYLLYGLLLRFTSEQKIKEIIGGFQIFITILIVVGFQVVFRLIDFTNFENITIGPKAYWLPPVWFAFATEAVHTLTFSGLHFVMLSLSVFVPLLTVWVMMKYLAPMFSARLNSMNAGDGVNKKVLKDRTHTKTFLQTLSARVTRNRQEQAAFEVYWKLMAREKQFKLQFFPSLAYIFVLIFINVFRRGQNLGDIIQSVQYSKLYLLLFYTPIAMFLTGLGAMKIYSSGDVAWIYYSTPVEKPGDFLTGGVKAIMLKFGLPMVLIMLAVAMAIWGLPVLDDFFLSLVNSIIACYLMELFSAKIIPFTRELNTMEQSGKFLRFILLMVLISLLVGLHYIIIKYYWLVQVMAVAGLVAIYFCNRALRNVSWNKIES